MSVGTRWAYREKPQTPGTPAFEAEIVRHGPPEAKQVRIRFRSGEWEGLEQWVPASRLVAPWNEFPAKERDDLALRALKGDRRSIDRTVVDEAAGYLDDLLPEPLRYWSYTHGLIHSRSYPEIEDALGVPRGRLLEFPGAFVDRTGRFFGPPECREFVARRICELHRDEVLAVVSRRVRELDENAVHGGYPGWRNADFADAATWAEWRREDMPALELLREWCGAEEAERFDEAQALRLEVDRLRKVIVGIAEEVRRQGRHHEFRRLLKEAGMEVPKGRLSKDWTPDFGE